MTTAMLPRDRIVSLLTTWVTHGNLVQVSFLNVWYTCFEPLRGDSSSTNCVSGFTSLSSTWASSFFWSLQTTLIGSAIFMAKATCATSLRERSQTSKTETSVSA